MKKTVAVALAIVFVLALAAPVFAQWGNPEFNGMKKHDDWTFDYQVGKQGSMDYNFDIKFDGTVEWERQIGHLCNTGAEWKMHAAGEGEMEATGSTKMVPWKLTAETEMDWVTAPDAVENLVVTSVIELCAPPKKTFSSTDWVYNPITRTWDAYAGKSGEYLPRYYYGYDNPTSHDRPPRYFGSGTDLWYLGDIANLDTSAGGSTWSPMPNMSLDMTDEIPDGAFFDQYWIDHTTGDDIRADFGRTAWDMTGSGTTTGGWNRWGGGYLGDILMWNADDQIYEFHGDLYGYGNFNDRSQIGVPGLSYSEINVTDLTEQIWAVQVEANPGMSGNLHQDFEAAYGPHESQLWDGIAEDETVHKDGWRYAFDSDGYLYTDRGVDYVGNYFEIDQMARTSDGVVKRFIDISSPFSGAYHYEDFEVEGMVEVEEDFEMMNIGEGEAATPDWWDLFQ